MLTKETLQANEVLADLTPEQISAIEELSKNDEDAVIGAKVGEIHRKYDETILKATGIERDGDEKSYNYLARAGSTLRKKLEEASGYKAKVDELKAKLESGSADEGLKDQYENLKAELAQTKEQYTELQGKFAETQTEYEQRLFGLQVDHELSQAVAGVKMKADLPESASKVLLQQAMASVKKNKADFIDDGQGGKRLVFRNEDGAIMNNPANQLNPYTASELLKAELKSLGVLDEGKKQPGAGTTPPKKSKSAGTIDISDARTQVEANEIITQQLLARGLTRDSEAFEKASTLAWRENKIGELPEQ